MQTFLNALLNTLMGMGTVFVVLIFISLIISLFVYIPLIEDKLRNRNKKAEEVQPATVPFFVDDPDPEPEEEELVGDEALVAVIMAAILAYEGGESTASADKLVVRSIRRAKRTGRR